MLDFDSHTKMVNASDSSRKVPQDKLRLPPPGQPVLVRCPHCRCMAFRDREGKWRDYFYRDELSEVLEIIPFDV